MAITFEDALRKSIKAYFAGLEPDELKSATGKSRKYNKKFFDRQAKNMNIEQDIPDFEADGDW